MENTVENIGENRHNIFNADINPTQESYNKERIQEKIKVRFQNSFKKNYQEALKYNKKFPYKIEEISKTGNLFLDKFANEVYTLLENDYLEYLDRIHNDNFYVIAVCPRCGNPVIAICDKVICLKKCFSFDVPSTVFYGDYSLDNLMEQYNALLLEHGDHFQEITVGLILDNQVELTCLMCEHITTLSFGDN